MPGFLLKPVIKVWCLPEQTQPRLEAIFSAVVAALMQFRVAKVNGKESVVVLFPTDAMDFGLGTEIIIECAFPAHQLSAPVQYDIAEALVKTLQQFFPKAFIQCHVGEFSGGHFSTIVQS